MKGIFTLSVLALMMNVNSYADVSQNKATGKTGTAKVDEHYLDSLNKKDAAPDRDPNLVNPKEKSGYDHLEKQLDKQKMEERTKEPGGEAESKDPAPEL